MTRLAILLTCLVWAGTSVGAMAQAPDAQGTAQAAADLPPRLEQARQRWDELSPTERQNVRKNYRRWKEMSEEQRQELRRRAAQLKTQRDKVKRELPADVKQDLEKLDRRKQQQVLRDLTEASVKENGRRIRSKMPQDFMQRLEATPAEARPEMLRRFKKRQRGRVSRAALQILGKQLELAEEEIRRLQAEPEDRRARAVLEMRHRLSKEDMPEGGLPFGMTWEQWDEWSRLSPEEFFGRIVEFRQQRTQALRRQRGLSAQRGGQRPREERRGPSDASERTPELDARRRPGSGPSGPRPVRADRPDRAGPDGRRPDGRPGGRARRSDAPLPRVLKRLAEAISPNPRDALELIELSRPERKAGMARRRRHRCMQLIQGENLLPESRVRQLEELSNEEFFDLVRQILVHTGHLGPSIVEDALEVLDEQEEAAGGQG